MTRRRGVVYDVTCLICETKFQSTYSHHLYCSSPCRIKAKSLREIQRRKENRKVNPLPRKTKPPKLPQKSKEKDNSLELVRIGLRKIVAGYIECLRCGRIFKSKDIRNTRICLTCHNNVPDIADLGGYEVNTWGANGKRRR